MTRAGSGSPHPASRCLVPACGGLGHTCGADTGDTGNLLDREMRPPEPQQTGIALGSRQGLEQRRIYARQDFARMEMASSSGIRRRGRTSIVQMRPATSLR